MRLCVYALLKEPPGRGASLGVGLRGEALSLLSSGELFAVVGEMDEEPPLEAATLRAYEATVRQLAASVEAILPVRFGSQVESEEALVRLLAPRQAELQAALALVFGREQMTLRVYGEEGGRAEGREGGGKIPEGAEGREGGRKTSEGAGVSAGVKRLETAAPSEPSALSSALKPARFAPQALASRPSELLLPPSRPSAPPPSLPGTRYLEGRRRALLREKGLPALEPLRARLGALIKAERVSRHATPPLLASVYHLISRGEGPAYAAKIAEAGAELEGLALTLSGPWPPYAFAPEELP